MKNILAKTGLAMLIALVVFLFSVPQAKAPPQPAQAKTLVVNCDVGQSIQTALDISQDGDVVLVRGDCDENVTVRGFNITLRGLDGATITADDVTKSVILVRGIDATIKDFSLIKDGTNGVAVDRASSALIQNNHIEDATDHGIVVNRSSFARIKDNMVHLSKKVGIKIMKSGSADLIGNFVSGTTKTAGSGGNGIQVNLGASADLEGNTSRDNAKDGLRVQDNAAVRLRGPANVFEKNVEFGIKCRTNSSVSVSVAQTFGTGVDANGTNTGRFSGCRTSGDFAF